MDYRKLDQMVPPITAAVPDVVSLPGQISTFTDVWYAAMGLASASPSLPANQDREKQLAFSCQGRQYTVAVLPQGYSTSPAQCHHLVHSILIAVPFLKYHRGSLHR